MLVIVLAMDVRRTHQGGECTVRAGGTTGASWVIVLHLLLVIPNSK